MKRVAVSLGHNPDAPGAEYPFAPWNEYTLVAPLFGYVINVLQMRGIGAYIVPTGSLSKKVAFINEGTFDLAIELHLNADPDPDESDDPVTQGCETLHFEGSIRGRSYAKAIQESLTKNLPVSDRGVKARTNLAFLRDTHCPAVILEPAFIDTLASPGELGELGSVLDNPKYVAHLIADAIEEVIFNS